MEKPCPRRITVDIPNRPTDIGRLPLSLFPTEDLTREISTPFGSDAQRPPRTPAMLRTPQRTPTHRQASQPQLRAQYRGRGHSEDLTQTVCRENTVATIRRPTRHDVPIGQAKAANAHADPLQRLRGC